MTIGRHSLTVPVARVALVLLLTLAWAGVAAADPVRITFLHTNDVYEIAPVGGQGGLAELGTLLKQERARSEHSITTFGGDLISPSLLSGLTKGSQMIDVMNRLGIDIAVPGNHEFDFGPQLLAERIKASRFPWLGTNVLGPDGKPAASTVATKMIEVAGYKIGFFGLLTPETDVLSSPGPEVTFAPMVETAAAAVKDLRAAGADLVVALTHENLADDRTLGRRVKGIDVILGGHDHDPMTIYEGGTLIVKAGHDADYLAVIDLELDRVEKRGKQVVEMLPTWRYLSTAGVAPDPEIQAVVDHYQALLDQDLGQPVGTTTVLLDSRRSTVRLAESNFGDLIADAMRAGVGAELALTNGGGIRGDRTYEPGTVLTRKNILTELPFGNVVMLIELSGADLLAALENGVSQVPEAAGRFPQVSGTAFSYDPAKPAGSRIVEVKVGNAPLDPGRIYKVATNEYIFGGGDGYTALGRGKPLIDASAATLMASMVMDYIAEQGKVAPKVEGRITRLE
jgi:2',3'-cyclic-nucleotide 2'-phosphodiesterase (5'-nucleotidase family)